MPKPLIKISDDQLEVSRPYVGRYRDSDGTPLHGVYIRQHKRTEDKLFIQNGNLMRKYKYPRIERTFSSPLLNDYNLHLCGGWHWQGVNSEECLTRVFDGKKPMGFFGTTAEVDTKAWVSRCQQAGLPGTQSKYEVGVCLSGTFGQHFDVEALSRDYCAFAMAARCPEICERIKALFDGLRKQTIKGWLLSAYANPETMEELIITGLMLGYPIESTVSILWME